MQTQVLRNANGIKIGEIEHRSDGIQILRDANGMKKGEYEPKWNLTRDRDGRRVGEGNLLASLLRP